MSTQEKLENLITRHPRPDLRPDGLNELPVTQQCLLKALEQQYASSKEVFSEASVMRYEFAQN